MKKPNLDFLYQRANETLANLNAADKELAAAQEKREALARVSNRAFHELQLALEKAKELKL